MFDLVQLYQVDKISNWPRIIVLQSFKALDEINAGEYDGMTYEEIEVCK